MAELKDKVQNALDEARMLILGSQVLLGFQFRAIFEPGFEKLPGHSQYLKLLGLVLMTAAIGLLMWPGAYHRIVNRGEDSEDLHRFTGRVMQLSMLPFALGLGIDFFVATEKVAGTGFGIISGALAVLVALTFWYGLEYFRRAQREPKIKEKQAMEKKDQGSGPGGTKIKDKIKHVLTEARVVLPGAQALLGFQFATILMEGFEKLPESSKYIHLTSLALIALTVVLLMVPAAYHRIVERGEETEHFHSFASVMVVAAMVPLALGIAGDIFVVFRKVTESASLGLAVAGLALALFYGLWFGFTAYRKRQREAPGAEAGRQEPRAA
ncbi:MAG TPA: DUF6328 family protein [Blastocatellia bacterium]|jgi:DMSO reductase anchor subunit|nr:DUF6328 family protein [Blastocatellia bacterium]